MATAQNTRGTLGVTHFERNYHLSALLKELSYAKPDSFKVRLLEKISSIYWRANLINSLDSCIYYAGVGFKLSQQIQFTDGMNETLFLQCKGYTAKNDIRSAKLLLKLVHGEMRVRLLLVICEYFVFLPEQRTQNLDQAYIYLKSALRLTDSLHSVFWNRYCLLLSGKYYFERGDDERGKKAFLDIISTYRNVNDVENEAFYWSELGLYLPVSEKAYQDKIHAFYTAYKLFRQYRKEKESVYALRDLAETNMIYNRMDKAEKQIIATLDEHTRLRIKPSFNTYLLASRIFMYSGNFDRGLVFANMALKSANPSSQINQMDCYIVMSRIYSALENHRLSFKYDNKVLNFCLSAKLYSAYTFCHRVVLDYIALGQSKSALAFLNKFQSAHPPLYLNDKELMALAFGNVYQALGEFEKAEKNYLQMVAFDKQLQAINDRQLQHVMDNVRVKSAEIYFTVGSFYVNRKRFKEAKPYLIAALKFNEDDTKIPIIAGRGELEYQLYKVDSAARDYPSALKHYHKYALVKDSVFRATKTKQIEELQFRYESKQREQSLKLLQSQGLRKDMELRQLNGQRNLILGTSGLLLFIVLLVFTGYRNKQKSNRNLQLKQEKINTQNAEITLKNQSLEVLLVDKDGLIKEKDLLLKELNHRVKNNLQMVISLLNKQMAYLHDQDAVSAVLASKNRIQAMALIHQKFYNSSDFGAVNMKDYILELTMYLGYSFHIPRFRIQIKQIVEVESLDISQVVCLGLILNEAITNSIKHAFEPAGGGIINVSLTRLDHEQICLRVADNGHGLPPAFEIKKGRSLGIEMLLGLSKQLGGTLEAKNENGLVITVVFKEYRAPGTTPAGG